MKKITIQFGILFIAIIIYAFSCKKVDPTNSTTTIEIAEKTCQNISKNATYQLCFDSLVNDSRCPTSGACIWQGNATAKFSLTYNGSQSIFYLQTLPHSGLKNDTSIGGLYIKLLEITPKPGEANYVTAVKKAVIDVK